MATNVTKSHLRIRALCEGAILLALSIVLNYLSKAVFANLPNGGSVTLGMFPMLLYAHRWGMGRGFLIGFSYGLLDMLLDGGYAWGWQSIRSLNLASAIAVCFLFSALCLRSFAL